MFARQGLAVLAAKTNFFDTTHLECDRKDLIAFCDQKKISIFLQTPFQQKTELSSLSRCFLCSCKTQMCFLAYAENKISKTVLNRSCTFSSKPNTLDNLIENICLPNSLRLYIFSAFFSFIVHYTIVIDWLCSHRGANTVIC